MIRLRNYHVQSPLLTEGETFSDHFFCEDKIPPKALYFDLNGIAKEHRKATRRMNRISKIAYVSASDVMDRSGLPKDAFVPERFGTMVSTASASYDNVLKILRTLYTEGADSVSPIDFTYSVGNALVSGITMKYGLKGVSSTFPSSAVLLPAKIQLDLDKADYLLVGSYNVLQPEIVMHQQQIGYLRGDTQGVTPIGDKAKGMVLRELAVSMILEKASEQTEGCMLTGLSGKGKTPVPVSPRYSEDRPYGLDCYEQLADFQAADFTETMTEAVRQAGIGTDGIDAVFSCACGHPSLDRAELAAVEKAFPQAALAAVLPVYGASACGTLLLNSVAAYESFRSGRIPSGFLVKEGEKRGRLRHILVNGVDELGTISSGVWQWNEN